VRKIDLSGEVFGRLTVTTQAGSDKYGNTRWHCVCSCGNRAIRGGSDLRSGGSKSCGCLRKDAKEGKIKFDTCYKGPRVSGVNTLIAKYKEHAVKRGYNFYLCREEFESLIFSNCVYCGDAPGNTQKSWADCFAYNGIDRVDNAGDYVVGNVVPCCNFCNKAKGAHSLKTFLEKATKIAQRKEVTMDFVGGRYVLAGEDSL